MYREKIGINRRKTGVKIDVIYDDLRDLRDLRCLRVGAVFGNDKASVFGRLQIASKQGSDNRDCQWRYRNKHRQVNNRM